MFGLFYRVAESSLPPALIQLLLDTNNYTSTTRCLDLETEESRWLWTKMVESTDFCLSWSCTGHLLCFNISKSLELDSSELHLQVESRSLTFGSLSPNKHPDQVSLSPPETFHEQLSVRFCQDWLSFLLSQSYPPMLLSLHNKAIWKEITLLWVSLQDPLTGNTFKGIETFRFLNMFHFLFRSSSAQANKDGLRSCLRLNHSRLTWPGRLRAHTESPTVMTVRGSARLHFDVELTRAHCTAESHRRKCETVMKKCLFVFKDTSCHVFCKSTTLKVK